MKINLEYRRYVVVFFSSKGASLCVITKDGRYHIGDKRYKEWMKRQTEKTRSLIEEETRKLLLELKAQYEKHFKVLL